MHVLRASGGDTLRQGQGLGRHVLEGIRMPRAPTAPWRESWCLQLQVVPLQITGLSLALLCCILNPDAKRCFLLLYQRNLCVGSAPALYLSLRVTLGTSLSCPFRSCIVADAALWRRGKSLHSVLFPSYPSPPKHPPSSAPRSAAAQTSSRELRQCLCHCTERGSRQGSCACSLPHLAPSFPPQWL